jgi:hypothetical protein
LTDTGTQKQINVLAGEYGAKLRQGDPDAFSDFTAEVLATAGLGKLSKIRKLTKISPNYVKFENGKFVLRKPPKEIFTVKGRERLLAERVLQPSLKRPFTSISDFLKGRKPGQFKKFTKDPELVLKAQTVASGARPLSKQIELAGKEITAVNTASQQLTTWLKRKQIVRKPIPGEADFPDNIKNLLRKFDNGIDLSINEFAKVNKWLQKNVAPNITLLERSLYADPEKGFRISRLQIAGVRDATLKDILRGNFKLFDRQKPQVLIFENVKVAKFPKYLEDIVSKIKAGKQLTTKETNRLIAWQVKTGSGEFKPLGSTIYKGGKELEVTLAPGEFIKRIKRIGFTFIKGKKVDFVTAEIWKPSKKILEKIRNAKEGKLSKKNLIKLEKDLSKQLGKKVRIETPKLKKYERRALREDLPVLKIKGRFLKVIKIIRKPTPRKPTPKKPTPRKPTPRKPTPKKPTPRKPTPRKPTPKKPTPRKPTPRKPTPKKPTPRKPTPRKPTPRKPTPREPTPRKPTPREVVPFIRPPISLPAFRSPKIQDKIAVFEAIFRERKNIKKPYNKRTNPRIKKVIKYTTTRNKVLDKVSNRVLRSLSRSFEIRLVKTTKKKEKDSPRPEQLKYFNERTGKNPQVLQYVQKKGTSFKTIQEQLQLKALRRKSPTKTKKKTKTTRNLKKVSKKSSKK